jgi:hypothetical protein
LITSFSLRKKQQKSKKFLPKTTGMKIKTKDKEGRRYINFVISETRKMEVSGLFPLFNFFGAAGPPPLACYRFETLLCKEIIPHGGMSRRPFFLTCLLLCVVCSYSRHSFSADTAGAPAAEHQSQKI